MINQAQLYKQINKGQIENGEALLSYATPKSGELVLDVGCGTGELTFNLSEIVGDSGKVIALDPDKERIQIAKQSQPKHLKNIDWINDYFNDNIIAPKPTFDLIFSNYVYHWFDHKEACVKLTANCGL
jgi:ubiquinone/menaquinone biosynthesis C-methylase UbiE